MELTWSEAWSVGDAQLDAEHRRLVDLVNAIRGARSGAGCRDLDPFLHEVVSELVAYAEGHFRHEEARMTAAGFPDLERHRRNHLSFRSRVMALAAEAREPGPALEDFHAFLVAWLRHHVLEEDQAYRPYL